MKKLFTTSKRWVAFNVDVTPALHSEKRHSRLLSYFLLSCLVGLLFLSAIPASVLAQTNFTWSLSSNTNVTQFDNQDSPFSVIKDGSDLWVIYGDGSGTWHRFKGTTMDNLVEQSSFNTLSASSNGFIRPGGDDVYWPMGGWRDPSTGTWYVSVHIEFHYGSPNIGYNHFRRVGFATSTDNGATWTYQSDILSSDNPTGSLSDYSGNYFDFGVGDQQLYVDTAGGYFYLYWENVWFNKSTAYRYISQRVSRSPISSKMAAGSWNNWYNGNWNEPGLGGRASDLPAFLNTGAGISVFYSSYLNKFVGIGITQATSNAAQETAVIATATDLTQQNWTIEDKFTDGANLQWYNAPVDPSTWDRMTIGQTFRLYSASNNYLGHSKYMTVTLGSGTTNTGWTDPQQRYPGESVNDGNYPYQWNLNPDGSNNLALGKTATQSSTLSNTYNPTAAKAIDGNVTGDFPLASVTHTNSDAQAWWQVDLGASKSIGKIKIYNRTDCCADRLSNFYVFVSDNPFSSTDLTTTINQSGVSNYFTSGLAPQISVFNVNRTGRFVRVQLSGTNNLSLAEVQVLSPNIASGTSPTQSSTFTNTYNPVAGKAVDGNTSGDFTQASVTHTNLDAQAWWQVDLGASKSISQIRIYNRTDCCADRLSNFYVFVSDNPFSSTDVTTTVNQFGVSNFYTSGQAPQVSVFNVNRTGRYIRVQLTGTNYLSLAEVQIWAS